MPISYRPVCIALVLATFSATALAKPKQVRDFDDEDVRQAIQKGIKYLFSQQNKDGTWHSHGKNDNDKNYHAMGPTALACYALMESGINVQDSRLAKAIEALKEFDSKRTYTLGLRAQVWLAAEHDSPDQAYRQLLARDVAQLARYSLNGAYGYYCDKEHQSDWIKKYKKNRGKDQWKDKTWDNSNSQYGLLGAWAGLRANLEVPERYLAAVLRHWQINQNKDGGWGYRMGEKTTATMAAAGLASMYVCHDYLNYQKFANCVQERNDRTTKTIEAGLEWFDKNFTKTLKTRVGHGDHYYHLYGVERIGLASGYKYFGNVDWYRTGTKMLLAYQKDDGSFEKGKYSKVISTSYALLFLIRGRRAVILNKLRFDGDWNNRPRDCANYTKWVFQNFENEVAWQIINMSVPVREWHDAPILYISGSRAPNFTDDQIARLREFVFQGGTIFSVSECGGREIGADKGFSKGIRDAYARMFEKYELTKVPADHAIYSREALYDLRGAVPLYQVNNGIRPLVIHTDVDLSQSWQLRRSGTFKTHYQVLANVLAYTNGKKALKGGLRARGTSLWPEEPQQKPSATIKVARIRHAGNFDPEPLAMERLSRLMTADCNVGLDVVGDKTPSELNDKVQVAMLTGTGSFNLPASEQKALAEWVNAGGTLVIDAAGGKREFSRAAEDAIQSMFGRRSLRYLRGNDKVFTLKGAEIRKSRLRGSGRGTSQLPVLDTVRVKNRPAVYFSRDDLTAGLVGYNCIAVEGHEPENAYKIMRNIMLVAADMEYKPNKGD